MQQVLQEVSRNIWAISISCFLLGFLLGSITVALISRQKFWHPGQMKWHSLTAKLKESATRLKKAWPRGLTLFLAGVAPIGILLALGSYGVPLFPLLLERMLGKGVALEGKDLVQSLLLLCSVPAFYFLWLWRDQNMQHTIENQRKDTNLKDFQETQRRAAGQIDDMKDNPEAAHALQIAALHQLRPFLKGEHGESFRRPAFEMYRALLDIHGTKAYGEVSKRLEKARKTREYADFWEMSESTLRAVIHSPIYKELLKIVQEDPHAFFHKDFPLEGITLLGVQLIGVSLDGLYLPSANLIDANLSSASFIRANLDSAHLEGTILFNAQLAGANLSGAHLQGAALEDAHLEGATLWRAHLEGAILFNAQLAGATLLWAHLEGADLSGAHLDSANLRNVSFDDKTRFGGARYDDSTKFGYWNQKTQSFERVDEHREALRALGLRHVSEFPKKEAAE